MKKFCVYILASGYYGTLYTGVTSDLIKRVYQHKNKVIKGFTTQYDVNLLVYYEQHDTADSAILREKQVKSWKRQWKINLIEEKNTHWEDLYLNLAASAA